MTETALAAALARAKQPKPPKFDDVRDLRTGIDPSAIKTAKAALDEMSRTALRKP